MNHERTVALLGQRFAVVAETGPDIFRAEQHHAGRRLGIFYFDFSGVVLQTEFDLQAYAQRQIAPDFYQHEGSLQWNFYLYFVVEREAFETLRTSPRFVAVESDRTYARKFIRERETLDAELAAPLANLLHSTAPKQDLASVWSEKLAQAGLARIADPDAGYDASVREIIAGKTAARPAPSAVAATTASPGRFIQSLRLDHFREHPVRKSFEFATANLVRGVNGAGKTSLLEAIEVSICGGIRRQDGVRPARSKIQVHFAGQPKAETCPAADLALYRARDLHWYGGYSRARNQLCHNFARFNFFDSDAAFRLSSATNNAEIVQALDSLLLGERATSIEERMKQFQERLRQLESTLRRLRALHEQDRSKASAQLEELKVIKDTREALSQELQAKAGDCGWQKLPATFNVAGLAVLQEEIEGLAEQLGQHVDRLPWLARVSVATLSRDAKKLGDALKLLEDQRKRAKVVRTALEQGAARIENAEAKLRLLRRLNEFHAQPDGIALIGARAAIKDGRRQIAVTKEAATRLRGLDLAKYASVTVTLTEHVGQHTAEISKRRKALVELNGRAAELQTQIGELKTVAQGIKGLGQRFCQLSPHSTDCPLCGAHYQRLADQIAKIEFSSALENAVRDLTVEINREQTELERLAKATAEVTRLSEAARLTLPAGQAETRSVKSIAASLANLPERQATEKLKLDELIGTNKRLELAGFSEEELEELVQTAQDDHALARTRLLKKGTAQLVATQTHDALEILQAKRREDQKLQNEIETEIRRNVKSVADELTPDGAEVELERRTSVVEEILAALHTARKSVVMSDSEDVSSVRAHLASFANVVGRLQEALKRVDQKDKLEQGAAATLAKAKAELEKIVPQHDRAKAALVVLAELLGNDYKAAFTRQVLIDHQEKLSAIFSRIHSPHEFKAVSLSPDLLLERHTATKSGISEISTGQRAALALAIFLSLNSSVSERAPWLIFDDPIVHVDDLNVLSFLDVLRDLALLGDRQIFFATANTRIADLFTKKFDCLDKEFQPIPLAR